MISIAELRYNVIARIDYSAGVQFAIAHVVRNTSSRTCCHRELLQRRTRRRRVSHTSRSPIFCKHSESLRNGRAKSCRHGEAPLCCSHRNTPNCLVSWIGAGL